MQISAHNLRLSASASGLSFLESTIFELIQLKLLAQFSFNAIYAYPAQFCTLVKNQIRLSLQLKKAKFKLFIRDTNEQDKN